MNSFENSCGFPMCVVFFLTLKFYNSCIQFPWYYVVLSIFLYLCDKNKNVWAFDVKYVYYNLSVFWLISLMGNTFDIKFICTKFSKLYSFYFSYYNHILKERRLCHYDWKFHVHIQIFAYLILLSKFLLIVSRIVYVIKFNVFFH